MGSAILSAHSHVRRERHHRSFAVRPRLQHRRRPGHEHGGLSGEQIRLDHHQDEREDHRATGGGRWGHGHADSHSSPRFDDQTVDLASMSINGTETVPPASVIPVIEYFNAGLGHYFVTADAAEQLALDGGAYGGAWTRTGNSFEAWSTGGELSDQRRCAGFSGPIAIARTAPDRAEQPLLHGQPGRMRVREDGVAIRCRRRCLLSCLDLREQRLQGPPACCR